MTLPGVYAVLDADVAAAHGWTVPDLARAVIDGGGRLLQVRARRLGGAELLDLCEQVARIGEGAAALVVVNDRADLAALSGAAGVHVGQDDLPPGAVRRIVGPDALVGWSTHTVAQVDAARDLPVSYVAVGPVFETTTKDTGYAPVGCALVREAAARLAGCPVVAIGGITLERAPEVVSAGAASVAVVSDLFTGGDPAARTRELVAAVRAAGGAL